MNFQRSMAVCVGLLFAGAAMAADQGFYFGVLGGQAEYEFERPTATVLPPVTDFAPALPRGGFTPFPPGAVVSVLLPGLWLPGDDDEDAAWGARSSVTVSCAMPPLN